MPPAQHSNRLGIAFALTAASFYGLVPNLAKLAFLRGIPATETVFFRTLAVAAVLGAAALLWRKRLIIPRTAWGSFAAQALSTLMVSSCYLASVQFLPVGLAVIIFFSFPVLIALLAPVMEGRAPSLQRIGVAAIAFAGLAIATQTGPVALDPLGLLLAAGAALGCAFQFFSGRAVARHVEPVVFGSLVHAAILPAVLAITLFVQQGITIAGPAAQQGSGIAVLGVCFAYVAGYFLHMSSVKMAPASIVAPYFNFEPVVTTVIAITFLGERLSFNQAIGAALVIAALVAAGFVKDNRKEPA